MIYPTTILAGEDGHSMAVHLLTEDRVEIFVDGNPITITKAQFDAMVSWVSGNHDRIKEANSKIQYHVQ